MEQEKRFCGICNEEKWYTLHQLIGDAIEEEK